MQNPIKEEYVPTSDPALNIIRTYMMDDHISLDMFLEEKMHKGRPKKDNSIRSENEIQRHYCELSTKERIKLELEYFGLVPPPKDSE